MGAGYAAWMQEVDIENAVNTGKLEFTATLKNPKVFNRAGDTREGQYGAIIFGEENGKKTLADKDNQELWVQFKDAYANYRYEYSIDIENHSTMGVAYQLELLGESEKLNQVAETLYRYNQENQLITLEQLNQKLKTESQDDLTLTLVTTFKKNAALGTERYSRFYGHKLKFTAYQFNIGHKPSEKEIDPNNHYPQIGLADWEASKAYQKGDKVVFTWEINEFDWNLHKKYYYKAEFICQESNVKEKPLEIGVFWKEKANTKYWKEISGSRKRLGTSE